MIKKLQQRNEPRRGRGFGFVNLASNELQSRAVEEMNGKDIEGRTIAVKIAIDSPDKVPTDVKTETVVENGETTNGINETCETNGIADSKNGISDPENGIVDSEDNKNKDQAEIINDSSEDPAPAA